MSETKKTSRLARKVRGGHGEDCPARWPENDLSTCNCPDEEPADTAITLSDESRETLLVNHADQIAEILRTVEQMVSVPTATARQSKRRTIKALLKEIPAELYVPIVLAQDLQPKAKFRFPGGDRTHTAYRGERGFYYIDGDSGWLKVLPENQKLILV